MIDNSNLEFVPPSPLNVAVLFLVFNRLEHTIEVFKSIQLAKPPRIYIAADGAREGVNGEQDKVDHIREFITNNIDWDCEVYTLFRKNNLGCKLAVNNAISWFFKHEEMGIILEDDCLPSQSFFWYCEELLNRYKNSKDIFCINGIGEFKLSKEFNSDYSFTKYIHLWGWASWRRVWDRYDVNISDWMENKLNLLDIVSDNINTKKYWKRVLQGVYDSKIDTWDYQFSYLILKNHGKCIIPKVNLVSNIGFGTNATHTLDPDDKHANRITYNINFPIKHPDKKIFNSEIDKFFDNNFFTERSIITRIIGKIHRIIRKILRILKKKLIFKGKL